MEPFLPSSSRITHKKRKIILATPKNYSHQFDSSLQIISQRTFEAAVNKRSRPENDYVGLTLPLGPPPPNNDQTGSSLQIIDRSVFEAAGKKIPKTTKSSLSSAWVRSICLGEGAHGVVHLFIRNDYVEGDALPSKITIKSANILSSDSLRDEEHIVKVLSSPHVITFCGSNITQSGSRPLGSDYNLMLEYCSGGSIADFLKFRGSGMVETDVQLFALHILTGINYVHSKKIIHCDIKPGNILLKPAISSCILGCLMPNGFEPKLADFGLALRKTSDEYGDGSGFARGTLLYMSPELLVSGNLDCCADIWSYGCTLLEMFTGKKPWSELGLTDRKKLKEVICNSNFIPEIPMSLSDDARDFIGRCLEKDPKKRYDSMNLLKHKFLVDIFGHSN